MLLYQQPDGTFKDPDWDAGYDKLIQLLEVAPSRTFTTDSSSMDSNVESSWSGGSNHGFFGLWHGSSYQSSYSSTFAKSTVHVQASFDHVLQFSAVPGKWYDSSAMGNAYSNKTGLPWVSGDPINWGNTFDPNNGNLNRFATNLIVVDHMNIEVTSSAKFEKNDQEVIRNNSHKGMWPFYCKNEHSGKTKTDVSFTNEGMSVSISSEPGTPIVIGLTCIPVEQFVGHSVEGARMYKNMQEVELTH
jgi:hypothetical protein